MTVRKILNTTRIRRVLTHSFAAALIAKGGFLSTASAKEIVIDFKNGKITEDAIWKRLNDENEDKIRAYQGLTEKFKESTEAFSDPFNASIDASRNDSVEKLIESFIAVVPGGKALKKRDAPSQNTCTLFKPQNIPQDESEPLREMEIRFLTALAILEMWGKNKKSCENDTIRAARADLHAAGDVFYRKVFSPIFSVFPLTEESAKELKKACAERVKSTKEAQAEELVVEITLKNGSVDSKTSKKLFENLDKGLHLTLDHIKGTISANEVLEKRLISIAFLNSELALTERCFQNSQYLEQLTFKNSTVTIYYQCFANCDHLEQLIFKDSTVTMYYLCFADCVSLESPEYENLLLYLPYPSNLFSIFAKDPHINKEFIREMATNCFRERCKRRTFEKEQDAEDYLVIHTLGYGLMDFYHRCKAEKRCVELEKQLEVFKKTQKQLESRNSRLEQANESQREAIRDLPQQKKRLTEALRTQKEELSKKDDELLKLSAEYENFKKQHEETVEKLTNELKGTQSAHDLTKKQLRESRDTNRGLRKELKNLQSENETQKKEIESLKAFKEEWKDEIETIIPKLEEENKQLKKQLEKTDKERVDAKEMLNREREKNRKTITEQKQTIKELKENLEKLQSELAKTQKHLLEAQKKIDDFRFSEANILTTVGMLGDILEEPKEEVNDFRPNFQNIFRHEEEPKEIKNDFKNDFRPNFQNIFRHKEEPKEKINFQKDIFRQAQNANKKNPFYSKKKGKKSKKGGKYVEYNNGEFVYE